MSLNENAVMQYESGVTPFPMAALADSGDHITFDSMAMIFSGDGANSPVVRPNGIINGGTVAPSSPSANNAVDIAAIKCNLQGVETVVTASLAQVIARASANNVASVSSITITSAGAIAVIKGTDGTTTTFSEVRGAAGAPPFIPVTSIEVAQVRTITNVAAPIKVSEIFQVPGTHSERSLFPGMTINYADATISFSQALPLIHTGNVAKSVFASYAEPVFSDQDFANDFKPAEISSSVSSQQKYDGKTLGSSSNSLGQASFTASLEDGITDDILSKKNRKIWFRFYQERTKLAHILTLGKLSLSRTFGATDHPSVTCTIAAEQQSIDKAS